MKERLYVADLTKSGDFDFRPTEPDKFLWLVNFLNNEAGEDEKSRACRIQALFNGEVVCTNLHAYKLVRDHGKQNVPFTKWLYSEIGINLLEFDALHAKRQRELMNQYLIDNPA